MGLASILLEPAHALHGLWRRVMPRQRLSILMYHGVVERPLEPFCWHQLEVDAFRRQLEYLKARFTVLPLTEALARLAEGTLPKHAAAITFDDGFLNNKTLAWPILRALKLPATIFLVTDKVGSGEALWPDRLYLALRTNPRPELDAGYLVGKLKGLPADEKNDRLQAMVDELCGTRDEPPAAEFALMDWDDVAEMNEDPLIDFGPRTRTHEILSRLPDDEVHWEIAGSCLEIERRFGTSPTVFAYPNGRLVDFDQRAKDALTERGVVHAVSTEEGLARPDGDPLAIRRICVGADLPFARFRHLVHGTIDWLKRR